MANFETSESARKEILKSHYFKASYEQVKQAYLDFLKAEKHKVLSINDDYCEVFSEQDVLCVTAKIISQNTTETSIDFYVDIEATFGKKRVFDFFKRAYDFVGAKYQLKGVSLHP